MLTERENILLFMVSLACGNAARQVIKPESKNMTSVDLIVMTDEYVKTNKIKISDNDYLKLLQECNKVLDKTMGIMVHLVTDGYLFKDDYSI